MFISEFRVSIEDNSQICISKFRPEIEHWNFLEKITLLVTTNLFYCTIIFAKERGVITNFELSFLAHITKALWAGIELRVRMFLMKLEQNMTF